MLRFLVPKLSVVASLAICLALIAPAANADELDVLRLSPESREALMKYLDETPCDCGCGMTVSQCLHEDPVCEASPRMARDALARFRAQEPEPQASPVTHHEHGEGHHHEHHKENKAPDASSADAPRGKTGA